MYRIKILFLSIILFSFITFVHGQSTAVVSVLENLKTHYNSEKQNELISLFSDSFLEKVPSSTIENLFANFKKDLGNLQSFTFQKKEAIVEVYETQFDHGAMITSIALDEQHKIIGLHFAPDDKKSVPFFSRNSTPFILPFKGDWFTFWGGDNKAQNYHVIIKSQQGAFDFVILGKNNKSYQRSGTRNEDYFAFGKPLYAVCDAEVVEVIKGIHDNPPGRMNPSEPFGNKITLKTAADEYIVYAHFEEGSIRVKKGDIVKQGAYLGNCGNSGNSSEPHLHFHLQDRANTFQAIGATSYFSNIMVNNSLLTEYSPVKMDFIGPKE